eukprot:TRINITY_DN4905_c1_g2_i1.p1 TRINITY_DN4905_c1_g2~~TRINITY_DN4905_c1_g2_i1.p1  ORF type:complete len:295 (+),score=84.57 TRINITY_DN4905_c1_g2_i1:46-885(+)
MFIKSKQFFNLKSEKNKIFNNIYNINRINNRINNNLPLNCLNSFKRFYFLKRNDKKVVGGIVSPKRQVSPLIKTPPYIFEPNNPKNYDIKDIQIKNEEEIDKAKEACNIAAKVLKKISKFVIPGVKTDYIDEMAHYIITSYRAYPSPLGYKDFPKSICTSVNEVACHGIPDSRCLERGDIINLDVTVYINGFHGDCSATFIVGETDLESLRLVNTTKDCLMKGIEICGPGVPFSKIGYVINSHAQKSGYDIPDVLVGHGIGKLFHEPPHIFHVCILLFV